MMTELNQAYKQFCLINYANEDAKPKDGLYPIIYTDVDADQLDIATDDVYELQVRYNLGWRRYECFLDCELVYDEPYSPWDVADELGEMSFDDYYSYFVGKIAEEMKEEKE